MQMGSDNELRRKQGRFQCFVAYDLCAESRAQCGGQGRGTPGADVPPFFKYLLAEPLRVRPVPMFFNCKLMSATQLEVELGLTPKLLGTEPKSLLLRYAYEFHAALPGIERGPKRVVVLCRLALSCHLP